MTDQNDKIEKDGRSLARLDPQSGSIFSSLKNMNDAVQIAEQLSSSDLVPASYKNNVPNTLIALEMASRIGTTPFMVMQNLDIIQGKPSWRASFIISAIQASGRFKSHRFEWHKRDDESGVDLKRDDLKFGCRMVAIEKETGEELKGPWVTWEMVKGEGWDQKKGSKWKHMPELMFQYRAATFFGRLYCPDVLNGMHTAEEVVDITYKEVRPSEEESSQVQDQRVMDWINQSTTVEELEQVEQSIGNNEQLKLEFDKKKTILTNGNKKNGKKEG